MPGLWRVNILSCSAKGGMSKYTNTVMKHPLIQLTHCVADLSLICFTFWWCPELIPVSPGSRFVPVLPKYIHTWSLLLSCHFLTEVAQSHTFFWATWNSQPPYTTLLGLTGSLKRSTVHLTFTTMMIFPTNWCGKSFCMCCFYWYKETALSL